LKTLDLIGFMDCGRHAKGILLDICSLFGIILAVVRNGTTEKRGLGMQKATWDFVLIGLLGIATIGLFKTFEGVHGVSVPPLKDIPDPVVTITSSGIWFLTLAVAGWRAARNRPAHARAKVH
jgi:hypothetical protein